MNSRERRSLIVALVILVIFYSIKFIVLNLPSLQANRQWLVPFNLVLSAVLLLLFHRPWNRTWELYFIIVFLASFLIEIAGVKTGKIFGDFTYGSSLGISVAGVPIVIGLNWLMLICCAGGFVRTLKINNPWRELTGASIMVLMDYLIEPVAARFGWWQWADGNAPLQNYIAWFYLSFIFLLFFFRLKPDSKNLLAVPLLILQAIFYLGLNIEIWTTK